MWDPYVELNSRFALYSHGAKDLVAIIPNIQRLQKLPILRIADSPLLKSWLLTILLFLISRRMFTSVSGIERTTGHVTFYTFALLIGAGNDSSVRTISERILVAFISIIGLLEGNILCGQLFSDYSTQSYTPAINSITELKQSSLSVQIPDMFSDLRTIFGYKSITYYYSEIQY